MLMWICSAPDRAVPAKTAAQASAPRNTVRCRSIACLLFDCRERNTLGPRLLPFAHHISSSFEMGARRPFFVIKAVGISREQHKVGRDAREREGSDARDSTQGRDRTT